MTDERVKHTEPAVLCWFTWELNLLVFKASYTNANTNQQFRKTNR